MFVILSYDVNKKRNKKVLAICREYLSEVLESVYEGELTEKNLRILKSQIQKVINTEEDSICIYRIDYVSKLTKEQLGKSKELENII